MFEQKVPSVASVDMVDGRYRCFRPAYNDYISLTEKDHRVAIRCIAFSTLNLIAAQNAVQAFMLGFSNDQVEHSADNYSKEKRNASMDVYSLLD